jgi:hypothetical protein
MLARVFSLSGPTVGQMPRREWRQSEQKYGWSIPYQAIWTLTA